MGKADVIITHWVNVEQLLLTAPSVTTLVTALMHGQAVFKTLIVQAYAIS